MEITYSMNIELNFVYNSNIRLNKFDVALESFLNVIKVKEDHAIAHYYAGVCHERLYNFNAASFEYEKALHFLNQDSFWEKYVSQFNIPIRTKKYFNVTEIIPI